MDAAGRTPLHLAGDPDSDGFLTKDPLALLVGMLLDQQVPMERAFRAPWALSQRLAAQGLDFGAAVIADADPEALAATFSTAPALHRFPGAMAARVQSLCREITTMYDGDAASLWEGAATGKELLVRLSSLPGFGSQKAQIFTALLGKQLGVRPPGWREAAGAYGEEGVHRSVADVTGPESLAAVREYKKAAKAALRDQ